MVFTQFVNGQWSTTPLDNNIPTVNGLSMAIDPRSGQHYVSTCDTNGLIRIYSDRGGAWSSTTHGNLCNPDLVDSVVVGDKLFVVYSAKVGQQLTIASWALSTL